MQVVNFNIGIGYHVLGSLSKFPNHNSFQMTLYDKAIVTIGKKATHDMPISKSKCVFSPQKNSKDFLNESTIIFP